MVRQTNKRENSHRNFDWERFLAEKKRRRILSAVVVLFMVPVLLFLFYYFFQNHHYLVIALMMLCLLAGVSVLNFERKKPRARDIVLMASMTSLTTVANEICAHTLPLHAGTAFVILAGIGLGPENGFFIGALSRFLCNFFDGQGPWTPWQMAAWGLIGYMAGLMFNTIERSSKMEKQTLAERLSMQKRTAFRVLAGPAVCMTVFLLGAYLCYLFFHDPGESFLGWRIYAFGTAALVAGVLFQRKRLPAEPVTITVFTFFFVLLIYGGIMNAASLLMSASFDGGMENTAHWETLKALYLTGFPYDLSHAAGAALCIFVFGDGILQRIERIRIRFGIGI